MRLRLLRNEAEQEAAAARAAGRELPKQLYLKTRQCEVFDVMAAAYFQVARSPTPRVDVLHPPRL